MPVRSLLRLWVVGFAVFTTVGLLMFAHFYLDVVARAGTTPLREPLIEELTATLGVAVFFPWIVQAARRFPLDRRGWPRRLPAHLAALAVFSALHTTWNRLTRELAFPLAGLGDYDYGAMPARYLMELPTDVLLYSLIVAFVYLLDHYHASRERALRLSQLETRLARAQLENLQTQLNPHFLFNVLNTVSSVMYEDVVRADTMLAGLCDLLRRALQTSGRQEVTLGEELEVLELYLELMRARFGERLRVSVAADETVRDALVPTLVLQPLVENAVRHGAPPPPETARIEVRAAREGGTLVLQVDDNGPGPGGSPAPGGSGVGLANTAERVRGLYGDDGSLELRDRPGGGARVRVRIPFHRDPLFTPAPEDTWSASAS